MPETQSQSTMPSAAMAVSTTAPATLIPLFFFISLLSAFLLFLVQPIMGKTILPFFGGSASVWTTCLLFFQSTLLIGYSYAHLLSTYLAPRWQFLVHTGVLGISIFFSSFLPEAPSWQVPPVIGVLLTLLRYVGIPFFALSTTAPLLQHWFFRTYPQRSPYPIYAVSNAGSFAAVLCYPFIIERIFPLRIQEHLWSISFGVFAVGCVACAAITAKFFTSEFQRSDRPMIEHANPKSSPSPGLWFGLSGIGSILLLTTTEQISQDVAATPLFWMIPLCIYLLTYVVCFSNERIYRRMPWLIALLVASLLVMIQLLIGGKLSIPLQLAMYTITLAIGCMVAHGELAALKPPPQALTQFYLWTSAGGIFGGLFVAVVAPFIFPDLWEYSLVWPLLFFLIWRTVSGRALNFEASLAHRKVKWLIAIGLFLGGITFIVDVVYDSLSPTYTSRNFYGRLTVSDTKKTKCLYHGRTLHGCEPKKQESLAPAFYYAAQSGVGVAYNHFSQYEHRSLRTGIVGLGVGLCATWNRNGDHMRFYEINPEVIALAKKKFTYLSSAQGTIDIVAGDARLSLSEENQNHDEKFDILVLDAFSSDAIPLHLLTQEAFDIYHDRIKDDGILTFHISNRHLDLEPIMRGAAEHLKWTPFITYTETDYDNYVLDTTWVILTQNPQFINAFTSSDAYEEWPAEYKEPLLFTDQYSNVLDLL